MGLRKRKATRFKRNWWSSKRRIAKIYPSEKEFEDSNNLRNDDIKHDKAQSLWMIGIYHSPIKDEEPSKPESSTPKSQLRRSKRIKNSNLRNCNLIVAKEKEKERKRTWDIWRVSREFSLVGERNHCTETKSDLGSGSKTKEYKTNIMQMNVQD